MDDNKYPVGVLDRHCGYHHRFIVHCYAHGRMVRTGQTSGPNRGTSPYPSALSTGRLKVDPNDR